MTTRSSGLPRRMSIRAVLVLAAVAVSLTAFAGSASAHFVLSGGTLRLVNGSQTGTPPSSGSWVRLPTDDPTAVPNYFSNTSSLAASPEYTLIDGTAAGFGLRLGVAQPAGGIFSNATTFNHVPFTIVNTEASTLTFDGADNGTGTRTLTGGNLTGLRISYGGATYNVGTTATPGGDRIVPLHGSITGNATSTSPTARITLDWTTNLTETSFFPYTAQFHLDAIYNPHP
jgi:hypothetical protein